MATLAPLTTGQADQYRNLEALWPEYGRALQVTAAFSGGMSWRKVQGHEYLWRYFQLDGRKRGKSLGPRNPDTERQYAHFLETTGKARAIIKERREQVTLACRIAKAHGIARLPSRFTEPLEWLWYTDGFRRLALFGGTALLAYEGTSGILAPWDLAKEDHLQFVACSDNLAEIGLDEMVEAFDVDKCGVYVKDAGDRAMVHSHLDRRLLCEIHRPSPLSDRIEQRFGEGLLDAIGLAVHRAVLVSRDSQIVEVAALDPRLYAMASNVVQEDDEIWAARSEYAIRLVRERWPQGFDEGQEAALDALHDEDWGRLRGP